MPNNITTSNAIDITQDDDQQQNDVAMVNPSIPIPFRNMNDWIAARIHEVERLAKAALSLPDFPGDDAGQLVLIDQIVDAILDHSDIIDMKQENLAKWIGLGQGQTLNAENLPALPPAVGTLLSGAWTSKILSLAAWNILVSALGIQIII